MTTQLSPEQPPQSSGLRQSPDTTSSRTIGKKPAPSSPAIRPRSETPPPKPLPALTQVIPFIVEVLVAAAGALVLWWGAEGKGVIHANQLSITAFIVVLTALLTGRGFVLSMLEASSSTPETLPTATRWLATIRNIALVAVAIQSKYLNDYMAQWIIAFAAIALAATGLAALVLAVIRRDSPRDITPRFLDSGAGVLAMVFTQTIHGWDPPFISTVACITLVPAFFAWTLTKTIRQD